MSPCPNPENIWPWYSEEDGPYDGAIPIWKETYKNWNIYHLAEVGAVYGITKPDCVAYSQSSFRSSVTSARAWIDGLATEPLFNTIIDFVVPDSLPEGSDVTVSVLLKNTGGTSGYLFCVIDGNPNNPDDYITVDTGTTSPTSVAPGDSMWIDIYFRYDKMPNWNFNLTARNYEGTSYINKTITLAAPEVASALIFEIDYWIDGMASWEIIWSDSTGPVPVGPPNYSDRPAQVGEDMYFSIAWFNTGAVAVTGHVDLELTSPSGTKYDLNAYSGQDRTQNPNSGTFVGFSGHLLNEAGTWQIKATLSHAGEILDEETTSFTVEAPPPDIKITTLNYPTEARAGEEIEISWFLKNEGGNGVIKWFRIRDLDTDGLVPPGEVGFSLAPGGMTGATIWPTMPNRNWRLRAETGYGSTMTDSRSFTITLAAPEPEMIVVYCWDMTSGSYLGGDWGKVTLDGVAKDPSGGLGIFHNIEVGGHTISVDVPGYDFDHWDSQSGGSWVEVLIDNPNNPSTGITTQSGGPGFLRVWVTKALPSSATVTIKGKATGGYPIPTLRLYIYDNGALVGYKDFSSISIGSWYTYEKIVTGAGNHQVYGKMRLRNALGSFYFETETEAFELG